MTQKRYIGTGLGLMAIKYGVDAGAFYSVTKTWWPPLDYLSPLYAQRMATAPVAVEMPPWFLIFLLLWGLLFAWIASMLSSMRAKNAGLSPWLGLLIFLPFLNYGLILILCFKSSARTSAEVATPAADGPPDSGGPEPKVRPSSVLLSGLGLLVVAGLLFAIMVRSEADYGLAVFLSLPLAFGVGLGYLINRHARKSSAYTVSFASLTGVVASFGLLLFALEGLVCILMAFPIIYMALVAGALLGRHLAQPATPPRSAPLALLFALPIASWIDGELPGTQAREVRSSVVIDAPPEDVWQNVVSFSELPEPDSWLFRTGVAFPMRARIEGSGVGAVRHCEFSTGAFVEPITVWDQPQRLAFDVIEQPEPMEEWSFYDDIHPPHLSGTFRSVRGEFRLVALPGGRTRLEGSTWYELRMAPQIYWQLWTDLIVHRIHGRVLRHVKELSE